MSAWSKASSTLSIAIVSICCAFAIPLFPTERNSNNASHILGIILCPICCCVISYASGNLNCFALATTDDVRGTQEAHEHRINWLSLFFFAGYALIKFWDILNLCLFAWHQPDCFSILSLLDDIFQLILGIFLILFINRKQTPEARPIHNCAWIWRIVGATCFSIAFKYVVNEVIWGYLDIVEMSIADPEYGLNITNGTTAEEFVPLMFKANVRCLKHVAMQENVELILELIPCSTEFFSLATVFCVVMSCKNDANNTNDQQGTPNRNLRNNRNACSLSQSLGKSSKLLSFSMLVPGLTVLSIWYFYHITDHHEYERETWVFICQKLILEAILMLVEVVFYWKSMRPIQGTANPPPHFELDINMLVLPLLPLGVLFTLRVFPDLVQLKGVHNNDLTTSEPAFEALNILSALFTFSQVAFQAFFLSETFLKLESNGLKAGWKLISISGQC